MRHTRSFPTEVEARDFADNITSPWGHEDVVVYEGFNFITKERDWLVCWIQWVS